MREKDAKLVHAITPSPDPLILVILGERNQSSEIIGEILVDHDA